MRKIMKNAVYTLLFLTFGTFVVLLAYSRFFAFGDENLSGEWTANLDMTQQAAVTALDWLQDIEAVSVSMEDMEPYMQDLTIQVNLNMKQTASARGTSPAEGTFRCEVLPESYEACNQAAYEAFAAAFQDLLGERLRMAGYTGGTEKEDIEALVTETFGMSTVSYLRSYGPALLPSLEDLQAQYDGSGTYKAASSILVRQFEIGEAAGGEAADKLTVDESADGEPAIKEEHYIRKDEKLILSGEADFAPSGLFFTHYPIIYTLQSS